jgi:outer membrane protein assembly complex protein YaeT
MSNCTKDSKTNPAGCALRKGRILSVLLFLMVFCSSLPSASQETGTSFIREVAVFVDGDPVLGDMRNLVPIQDGEVFSLRRVSESIKQLYRTGLFSEIEVVREGIRNILLIYYLSKKMTVRRVTFDDGFPASLKKMNRELFQLREGSPFSERKVNNAVIELKEILRREGLFNARIDIVTDRDMESEGIDVSFRIRSYQRYIVDRISFSGNVLVSRRDLRKRMRTTAGKVYMPSQLEADIINLKELYHDLDYRQVEISIAEEKFDDSNQSVSLVLNINPRDKIEIIITGASVPKDILKPIWEARVFEDWGLSQGEAKILEYLRKKGYLFSSIRSSVERSNLGMRVIHRVSKGDRYRFNDVYFQGVNYFTPERLKEELGIFKVFLFFGNIDGARLFDLASEIRLFYQRHGFAAVRVNLNFEKYGNKVKPVFYVDEGPQDIVRKIEFSGNSLLVDEILFKEMISYPGGPFFQPSVQRDIGNLETFYLSRGIRGTEIRSVVQITGENLYDLRIEIREGHPVRIENIIIAGHNVTQKKTIQKQLMVREGEPASYDKIQESRRRLEELGIFSEVKIEEIPISENRMNLLFRVREGSRHYASLGLGLETEDAPDSYDIWNNIVRLRAVAELIRNNMFGAARQLSFVGQLSIREKRAVVSWEQPRFFGSPLETLVSGWLESEDRKSYSFFRRGFSLSAAGPITKSRELLFSGSLRYARTTLVELSIPESAVDRQHFPYSTTSITGSYIWDKRNDPFNPEKGFFLSSALEWAYPLFNSESNYLKLFSKYQHFVSLFPGVTFSSTTRIGLGRGQMPIHERFFAGGSSSFRGVDFDELGPKDPEFSNPVGGKAMFLVNLELVFPMLFISNNLFGAVFYDKGNVFSSVNKFSWIGLQDAFGCGIRYKTPLGPIRLELGWNLDAPSGARKAKAFITIGNVF